MKKSTYLSVASLTHLSGSVGGEADSEMGRLEQVLLERFDLPVNLKIKEEEENERKQDQDYQVHPQNVHLGESLIKNS